MASVSHSRIRPEKEGGGKANPVIILPVWKVGGRGGENSNDKRPMGGRRGRRRRRRRRRRRKEEEKED